MTAPQAALRRLAPTAVLAIVWSAAATSGSTQQTAPAKPAPRAHVVLSEVLYEPRVAETPFVEILNAGKTPADVATMSLRIGEKEQLLRRVAKSLQPGERVVVQFDGQGRTDGRIVHSARGVTLPVAAGSIELRGADGVVDRIAWGSAPDAVRLGAGGLTRLEDVQPLPGRAIGRPPGANVASASSEWVAYPPGAATPGAVNPLPAIAELMPIDGAILEGSTARLTSYRSRARRAIACRSRPTTSSPRHSWTSP